MSGLEPYSDDHINGCHCELCRVVAGVIFDPARYLTQAEIANRVFLDWLERARSEK